MSVGRLPGMIPAIVLALAAPGASATAVGALLSADPSAPARLALDRRPDGGWVVEQHGRLVEVRFPGAELGISVAPGVVPALAGALDGVDAATRFGEANLLLTLGCDCSVAVQARAGGLIIDVVGAAVPPASPAVTEIAAAGDGGPAPMRAPMPPRKGGSATGVELAATAAPIPAAADALPDEPAESPEPPGADSTDGGLEIATATVDAEEARRRLMEQLLRAADAGFVELKPDPAAAAAAQPAAVAAADAAPIPDPASQQQPPAVAALDDAAGEQAEAEPQAAPAPEPSAGATEAPPDPDPDPTPGAIEVAVAEPEPRCFPDTALALPDMTRIDAFVSESGAIRRRMLGEFDRPDPDAAAELAKLYIAAGLGAEARELVDTYAGGREDAPVLREMSLLIDGTPLTGRASLLLPGCPGVQALWRAVALAANGQGGAIWNDAPTQLLEQLPPPVRQIASARIGLAAAEAADWEAVARLDAMARRTAISTGRTEGATLLLASRLSEHLGDEDAAQAFLNDARRAGGEDGAEALLRLAALALRSEAMLGADLSTLRTDLGALALEQRGTATGARAFDLEARLLAREAPREEVLEMLAQGVDAGLYPEDQHAGLLARLADAPAPDELSRPLAVIYAENPARFEAALLQPGFRRSLVRSMAEAGLPALAEPVLRPGDLADPALAALLAEAHIAAGTPDDALVIAGGLPEGPEKNRLLGQALLASGRADQARGHLASAANDLRTMTDELPAIIDGQVRASFGDGDVAGALAAAERLLEIEPTVDHAEEVALLALDAGRGAIPDAAAALLSQQAPGRLAALEPLFAPTEPAAPGPDALAARLVRLDEEIATIEALLNDG